MNKLVAFSIVQILIGVYIGPTRIGQYVQWMATDPDFFSIPACISYNCLWKMATCVQNPDCKATLDCITECQLTQPRNKQAICAHICQVTDGYLNEEFDMLTLCMIDNNCMSHYPQDGTCVAKETDGVPTITEMDQIQGDWWAVKGLNCGYNEEFPGGYDGFPCLHERWHLNKDGIWQNR